eukprot:6407116-Pyramimonas_sp.AAC.2
MTCRQAPGQAAEQSWRRLYAPRGKERMGGGRAGPGTGRRPPPSRSAPFRRCPNMLARFGSHFDSLGRAEGKENEEDDES